jgi:hypothetical protein
MLPQPEQLTGDNMNRLFFVVRILFFVFGVGAIVATGIALVGRLGEVREQKVLYKECESESCGNTLLFFINDLEEKRDKITFDVQFETDNPVKDKLTLILTKPGGLKASTEMDPIATDGGMVYLAENMDLYFESKTRIPLIEMTKPGRLFPFDRYIVKINFKLLRQDTQIEVEQLSFLYYDTRFNYDIAKAKPKASKSSLEINLERPWYIQLEVVVFLIAIVLYIGWAIARIFSSGLRKKADDNRLNLLDVMDVGVLVALPDIRGLLVPDGLESAFLVDTMIVITVFFALFIIIVTIWDIVSS